MHPQQDNHIWQYGCMKAKRANEVLAANIRRLLETHPILNTQAALAKRAGIAQSSIARVISAAVHPQLDVIESIAAAFKVSIADLLTEGDASPSHGLELEKFAELPEEDKEKAASYVRYLIAENSKKHGGDAPDNGDLVRIVDLHDLSEEQLAQVMRAALRELNHNTLAINESPTEETKHRKSRGGSKP
ncbi:helix-turn-helix domain-containing protein [Paraburkholderia guartelaensis]|uniref:Helix-turn-helix transcriptional regulator n=1 Tax=Paraburkholderia guartelaensis TaxID=2546446 RepID=A0ABU9SES8_9BURK